MTGVVQTALPTTDPDLLVVSRVVLDDLHHGDGSVQEGVLGGSGFWAALGASLVLDHVAVTCKVGSDFAELRDTMASLGISQDGLVTSDSPTSRTIVTYPRPGERHEEPLPNWDAHVAMRTMPDEFPPAIAHPRGTYVFRDFHPGFWEAMLDFHNPATPLVWEIPGSICRPEHAQAVSAILAHTAVLSLNEEEAQGLTGQANDRDRLRALHDLGAPVVALRRGGRGCLASDGKRIAKASPPPGGSVVDVTGAGNAFSGALAAAWVDAPHDLTRAVTAAMAAAAVAVSRIGPPASQRAGREQWRSARRSIMCTEEEW